MKTTAALACALILATLILGGCSTGTGPDPVPGPEYRDRLTPEDVIHNIRLAYVEEDVEEYLDCLSVDFVFYPDERDVQNPEMEIPPEWYKADERTMHENMFGEESNIENISLTLTIANMEYDEGVPADETDDVCSCVVDVDLRVSVFGNLTYLVASQSRFDIRIDQDQTGPGGAYLWEIYRWYDLGDPGRAGGIAVENATWGGVKAMYR